LIFKSELITNASILRQQYDTTKNNRNSGRTESSYRKRTKPERLYVIASRYEWEDVRIRCVVPSQTFSRKISYRKTARGDDRRRQVSPPQKMVFKGGKHDVRARKTCVCVCVRVCVFVFACALLREEHNNTQFDRSRRKKGEETLECYARRWKRTGIPCAALTIIIIINNKY